MQRRLNAAPPPLYYAIKNNNPGFVSFLLGKGATIQPDSFYWADVSCMETLINKIKEDDKKYSQDIKNKCYEEALLGVCSYGTLEELKEVIVKLKCFNYKKNINEIVSCYNENLLHCAAENLQHGLDIAKYLVNEYKCKDLIEKQDDGGKTPLHIIAKVYPDKDFDKKGHLELVTYLITNGAKTTVEDNRKNTPLHLARNKNCIDNLINAGVDINQRNSGGRTLLSLVAQECNSDLLEYLITKNADLNLPDNFGFSPLHHLAAPVCEEFFNKKEWKNQSEYLKIIKKLVENGADINAKTTKDNTVLHMAVNVYRKSDLDTVKYLVAMVRT